MVEVSVAPLLVEHSPVPLMNEHNIQPPDMQADAQAAGGFVVFARVTVGSTNTGAHGFGTGALACIGATAWSVV